MEEHGLIFRFNNCILVQFLNVLRKNNHMKKLILSGIFLFLISSVYPQVTKTDVLQDLEKNKAVEQKTVTTATLKSASRLFKDKDDLTSVIMIIPQDSVVDVVASDSTFIHVVFEGNEGYIYARHAEINKPVIIQSPTAQQEKYSQESRPVQTQKISRYAYLENKYGPSIAARLYEGKIWKGMSAQMVKDSWGSPRKINRVISGNIVKEEWFYINTWLHFQNSALAEWGPVK
jgi:hypothetical protein